MKPHWTDELVAMNACAPSVADHHSTEGRPMSEPGVEARAEALTAFVTGAVRVQSVSSNYGPAAIRALVDELGLTWEMVDAIECEVWKLQDMAERGEYWADEANTPESRTYPADAAVQCENARDAIAVILTAAGRER